VLGAVHPDNRSDPGSDRTGRRGHPPAWGHQNSPHVIVGEHFDALARGDGRPRAEEIELLKSFGAMGRKIPQKIV
jgi:hypothetical protein